jgi:hypothetical protein
MPLHVLAHRTIFRRYINIPYTIKLSMMQDPFIKDYNVYYIRSSAVHAKNYQNQVILNSGFRYISLHLHTFRVVISAEYFSSTPAELDLLTFAVIMKCSTNRTLINSNRPILPLRSDLCRILNAVEWCRPYIAVSNIISRLLFGALSGTLTCNCVRIEDTPREKYREYFVTVYL